MNNSPESDPVKHLQALTKKADASIDDDAVFDAAVNEINEKLLAAELEQLDELIGIKKQYESQLEVLRNAGLLSQLSDGSDGIIGVDATEYPIPSLLSIVQRFCEDGNKYELLRRKVEQGFTKMIMVPFASQLHLLLFAYAERLRAHKAADQLFGVSDSPAANPLTGVQELQLDMNVPTFTRSAYNTQKPVYFPTSFDPENHGGLTRQEAISQKGAWQVYLIEETPIPKKDQGANKNGRRQLEAGLKFTQYLEMLQADPQYEGEIGLTPESWLMRAMTRLKERGEVIDDYLGKGAGNMILGMYFPAFSQVAEAYWSDIGHRVCLDISGSINSDPRYGASTAVMI